MRETTAAQAGATTLQGVIETLLFYPLLLLLAEYLLPQPTVWLWSAVLPLLYGAGHGACLLLKLDKVYKRLAFVLIAGAGWGLLWFGGSWQTAFPVLWSMVALFQGTRAADREWDARFPMSAMFTGVGLYFALSIATVYRAELAQYGWLIAILGLLALAVTLYRFNADAIRQQTLSGSRKAEVASSVSWLNRLLVFGLLIAAVGITMLRSIQQAFGWLREQIMALLQLLPSGPDEAPPEQPAMPDMPQPPMMGEEPTEPSAFMKWLEQAAMIAMYVLIALVLLYACYAIGKRLPGWLRRLYKVLTAWINRDDRQGEDLGYVDHVESLIKTRDRGPGLRDRWKDRFAEWNRRKPRWSDEMTNEERVRYLYRRWLQAARKEGYELKSYLTPLETVADIERWRHRSSTEDLPVTQLYELVRFGDKPVQDDQVTELKRLMERYLS
ncbi:DUF4129 domain-containing protein [Paenibacillus daejeonensis]|uniref:DUF4129 domain-containing protein n=1 Tax=Paenibacillus daejeonensis TaxID=135193 RepID=UPI0003730CBE|nr:DUF4129 domain-containing protein [Paenibacillus daejeonensis]